MQARSKPISESTKPQMERGCPQTPATLLVVVWSNACAHPQLNPGADPKLADRDAQEDAYQHGAATVRPIQPTAPRSGAEAADLEEQQATEGFAAQPVPPAHRARFLPGVRLRGWLGHHLRRRQHGGGGDGKTSPASSDLIPTRPPEHQFVLCWR